ncbi:MAG TPA: type II toxin-antitoxin system RelE/ParE family toxin [Terracidiphilus sp.]|jgi:toxin ParE1/3/4|nr:type II toxin-antitoxin system RelE/ParE family toxin [Terracidiphilus sp.]
MTHAVHITHAAARDLEDIYNWIAEHDSPAKANYVLDRLVKAAESIAALPHRGSRPDELPGGAAGEFRQVFFKPYRVIYEVTGRNVIIHLIADGRRSLQSLLLRRLTDR